MNATAMPSNSSAMPSNSSAISSSGVIVSVVNSTLAAASRTLAGPHGPSETTLRKSAQTTRLLLGFILLEFVLLWLLCVILVVHVRYKRAAAFKGDDSAARKIILPAFEPLLMVLGVFNCAFMLVMGVAMASGSFDKTVSSAVLETNYSAGQFGFVLILVFMLQKSVSIPALRRAVAIALVLSGYTIPYVWYVTTYGDLTKQLSYVKGLHGLRALVLLLSVYVFIWPPSRASKRTLRELAVYSIIRYFLALLYMIMVTSPNPATRANSKYALYATLFWIVFIPLVIWRVLKADTEYWRGMGQRAVALQDLFKQQNHIHEGVSSEGLHVLIEMHRKYVIDFAYLDIKQQIGVGSTSTVFRGTLRSKYRVAVKVYQPSSFMEDVIAGFSHEAALCGLLHHPNIVEFFGMCMSPPTICLVFELCQGSLQDVLRVHSRRQYGPARQQLIINVGYMLDAAHAVAYLHSFSPPFVHRDIKPPNLQGDAECSVKLSDFGESRTLTQLKAVQARQQQRKQTKQARRNNKDTDRGSKGSTGTWSALDHKESPYTETFHETNESPLSPTATSYRDAHMSTEMTVKGTADYMAPEVIRGKGGVACYDQAADVYSLAITMWDILNPGLDKFGSSNQGHLYVFESVLSGTRPVLDPSLPQTLRDVIQKAIVSVLEDVQETLCAPFVVDVMDELQICVDHPEESGSHTIPGKFTGASAADVLLDHNYVSSPIEATRMGNAWMDAGLLHHAKHARAFENSAASLYFFDVDNNAKLRQAIDATRQSEPSGNSIPMLAPATLSQHLNGVSTRRSQRLSRGLNLGYAVGLHTVDLCACQKLGQRDKFRRKQFARRPAADDLVLTTALLMNDDDDDLDAFVDHGDSVTDSRGG